MFSHRIKGLRASLESWLFKVKGLGVSLQQWLSNYCLLAEFFALQKHPICKAGKIERL